MLYRDTSPVEQKISQRLTLLFHGRADAHPLQLLLLLTLCNTDIAPVLDLTSFAYRRPTSLAIGLAALTQQNPKANTEVTDYLLALSQDIITTHKFPESSHLQNETETLFHIVMAIPTNQQEEFVEKLIIANNKTIAENNNGNNLYFLSETNYAAKMLHIVACCPFRDGTNYSRTLRRKAVAAITRQQAPANATITMNIRANSVENFLLFFKGLNYNLLYSNLLDVSLRMMGELGYDIFATDIFKINDFRTREGGDVILHACVPAIGPSSIHILVSQLLTEMQQNPDYASSQDGIRAITLLFSILNSGYIKTAPTYQYLSSFQVQLIHEFFKSMTLVVSESALLNIMMEVELQIVNRLSTEHKKEITEALKRVGRNPTRLKLFHSVCAVASPETLIAEVHAMMGGNNNPEQIFKWCADQLDVLILALPHMPTDFKDKLTKKARNVSFSINITRLLTEVIDEFSENDARNLIKQIVTKCADYYSYDHKENELHDTMQLIKLLIYKISHVKNHENYPNEFFDEILKKMQLSSSSRDTRLNDKKIIFAKILTFTASSFKDDNRLILLKNLFALNLKTKHYYLLSRLLIHCKADNPQLNDNALGIPSILISFVEKIIQDLNGNNRDVDLHEYPVFLGHLIPLNINGDFDRELLKRLTQIIDISITKPASYGIGIDRTSFKEMISDVFLVYIELMKKIPTEIFEQNIGKILDYFRYFNARTIESEKFLISSLYLFPADRRQLIIKQCKDHYSIGWLSEDYMFLNPDLDPTIMNDIILTGREKIADEKKANKPWSQQNNFEIYFCKGLSNSLLNRFTQINEKTLVYLMKWALKVIKESYGTEIRQAVFGKALFTYLLSLSGNPSDEFLDFAQQFKSGIYECLISEIETIRQNNITEAIALLDKITNPQMTNIFPLTKLFQDERGSDYISGFVGYSYLIKIKNLSIALQSTAASANANNSTSHITGTVPSYQRQTNNNNNNPDNENPNELLHDPITMTTLVDPVTLPSGQTYSRQTLINTRAAHPQRFLICPMTRIDCSDFDEVNAPVNIIIQNLVLQRDASNSSNSL